MLCWLCLHSGKRHLPHRPPVAAGRRLPSRMSLSLTEMEAAAFGALEKEAHLDEKLGAGVGAQKERAVIQAAVQAYEDALAANEAAALAREAAEAAEDAGEEDASPPERTLYHVATDHIAVFGGDPARRKDKVSKRMPPTLRLYSPYSGYTYCPGEQAHAAVRLARAVRHAAGRGRGRPEAPRLADPQRQARRRILLDPVRPTLTHTPHPRCPYASPLTRNLTLTLIRFSNHGSRHAIRQACVAMPEVKFVEVGSLSVMNNCWSGAREAGATEADDEG